MSQTKCEVQIFNVTQQYYYYVQNCGTNIFRTKGKVCKTKVQIIHMKLNKVQ